MKIGLTAVQPSTAEAVVATFNIKAKNGIKLAVERGFCKMTPASVAAFLIDWASGPPPALGGGHDGLDPVVRSPSIRLGIQSSGVLGMLPPH